MKANRQINWLPASILVAILGMTGPSSVAASQDLAKDLDELTASHPWIGEQAPGFDLPSTSGQTVALEDFEGEKLLVIHFAASW